MCCENLNNIETEKNYINGMLTMLLKYQNFKGNSLKLYKLNHFKILQTTREEKVQKK